MTQSFVLDKLKKLSIYKSAKKIADKLDKYQILLVGGSLRDILAKRDVKDIDFATNATPDEIEKIFENTLDKGKKFGTITVLLDNYSFEITTFRKDFNYDGRHPSGVEFGDLKSDVIRRDFTCNALYFDLKNQKLIDYVKGLESIKTQVIKTVGSPLDRFKEDKLRMLRAIRFASELSWKIDDETYRAIKRLSLDIEIISKDRWQTEFDKIILSDNPIKGLKMLFDTKLLQNYFLRNFEKLNEKVNSIKKLHGSYEAKLASLLYTSNEDEIRCFVARKKQILQILDVCTVLKKNIDSLELWEIREINENLNIIDALKSENRTNEINKLMQTKKEYPILPKPLIDGHDVKNIVEKQKIKEILRVVRKMQLNETIKTRAQALKTIKSII